MTVMSHEKALYIDVISGIVMTNSENMTVKREYNNDLASFILNVLPENL